MTTQLPVQCLACVHLHGGQVKSCDAYPESIPVEVAAFGADHRTARGDERDGITFGQVDTGTARVAFGQWQAVFGGTDGPLPAASARSLLAAFDRGGGPDPSRDDIAGWARAAGADTHPGDGALKTYWTKGEGLAKWINEPHRWTALYRHLKKHMTDEMAKRVAAQWFRDVVGIWPGEQAGSDPNGPG